MSDKNHPIPMLDELENGLEHECCGEMIERIGWPRFFEVTNLPFTQYPIDNWRGSRTRLNSSTHIRC